MRPELPNQPHHSAWRKLALSAAVLLGWQSFAGALPLLGENAAGESLDASLAASPDEVLGLLTTALDAARALGERPVAASGFNGIASEPVPKSNFLKAPELPGPAEDLQRFEVQLSVARQQRRDGSPRDVVKMLVSIIESDAPVEFKRQAILELAYLAQDQQQFSRAQQIYAQYLHLFPNHPSLPEVYLRQGLLYRRMGAPSMAISKFYAVMTSSLTLKLDQLEYYQRLVLQAQTEIAETYFQDGKFAEAADFFSRLLRLQSPNLDKAQIHYKYIHALARLKRWGETVGQAQQFLEFHPQSAEGPEVRFLLSSALKRMGRNSDSTRHVLQLLHAQEQTAAETPDQWIYWRQRAGNEIANELYQEGDYFSALEIYLALAELDPTPAWQIPVWYQTGLVYERLRQSQRAMDIYSRIAGRAAGVSDLSPALQAVVEMANWRRQHVAWSEQAKTASLSIHPNSVTNPPVTIE